MAFDYGPVVVAEGVAEGVAEAGGASVIVG
jgi:hypothetical protein